ncbi:MAG: DMT family transporter [Candidatus Actinomarinales bacterium]|nr:MAG: DMT family transporter [Candidatus Actinomarinales bacterium]
MNKVLRAYLAITVLAVSWGTIPLIIKTSEISSISLVGIRTFIGSIFLSFFVIRKGLNIKDLIKPGLILGPLLAIHWVTMFESIELNSVTVGIGSVFSYPIFVLIIEKIKGKTLSIKQVLIIIFGFLGLMILLDVKYIDSLTGIFYGILSAISLALIITIGEKYSTELGGLRVAFIQLLVAGVCLIYFTIEGYQWMISNIFVSIFLGVFLTAIGLSTYWYVVKVIKPLSVSTITYLEPTTGVILGVLILNENIRLNQFVGFLIILFVGVLQVITDSKSKN